MFDEDFGRVRMEMFKTQCRNILGKPTEVVNGCLQSKDYGNQIDIVNAYKTLKQSL